MLGTEKIYVKKSKRKPCTVHPIHVKIQALNDLKNGANEREIAKDLDVHVETIRMWKKKENEIIELSDGNEFRKKRTKKSKPDVTDKDGWEFYTEPQSAKNTKADDDDIQEITEPVERNSNQEGTEVGGDLIISTILLDKFKDKQNIRFVTITNAKKSADLAAAENFLPWFSEYLEKEQLTKNQVFNCDETGLNYKSMPRMGPGYDEISSINGFREERITVMACSNASGSFKLPPFIIGRSETPKFIKGFTKANIYYRSQESAWMSGSLFREWFFMEFVPSVTEFLKSQGLPLKALLLVDNSLSHPIEHRQRQSASGDCDVRMFFFPANTTTLIQPMDQGILQCLKLKYRHIMMKHVLDCLWKKRDLVETLRSLNLKNAVDWVAEAWEEVPISVLQKAWKPLWPRDPNDESPEIVTIDEAPGINASDNRIAVRFLALLQGTDEYKTVSYKTFQDWLHPPGLMGPDEVLTDEEIVQIIREQQGEVRDRLIITDVTSIRNSNVNEEIVNDVDDPEEIVEALEEVDVNNECGLVDELVIPQEIYHEGNDEENGSYSVITKVENQGEEAEVCENQEGEEVCGNQEEHFEEESIQVLSSEDAKCYLEAVMSYCQSRPTVYSTEELNFLDNLNRKIDSEIAAEQNIGC